MEFKKIPAPAPVPQPFIDPDTQMRQSLRLMARRMLYGTRGILFITGSLLLVAGTVGLLYLPEVSGLPTGYWELFAGRFLGGRLLQEEWFTFADLFIALVILVGGALVTRLPLFFTLLPAVLLTGKIIWSVAATLAAGGIPGIPFVLFQLVLLGLLIRSVFEARGYRREAALAREYYRSNAILRQKEARR